MPLLCSPCGQLARPLSVLAVCVLHDCCTDTMLCNAEPVHVQDAMALSSQSKAAAWRC